MEFPAIRKWEKVQKIGFGAHSVVYKAIESRSQRAFALKEMDTFDIDSMDCLMTEINIMKQVHHPHILQYLGMHRDENQLCLFTEYAEDGSLHQKLNRGGKLSQQQTRKYTKQLLRGMRYLHQHKITHRDVKSDNLLLFGHQVKIADLGSSKYVHHQSLVGGIKGTPYWMAPEVIKDEVNSTGSIGCTVFEMLTGQPPWSEYKNPLSAMYHIVSEDEHLALPTYLSPESKSFLSQCFQYDATLRPSVNKLMKHPFIKAVKCIEKSTLMKEPQVKNNMDLSNNNNNSSQHEIPPLRDFNKNNRKVSTAPALRQHDPISRLPTLSKDDSTILPRI